MESTPPLAIAKTGWALWAGLLLYGFLIYCCLPASVVPLDDDFGYLRSVVETLQHHRPWTDDWLAPWAASLSVLSALLYTVTGNFYASTYGLLALLAAVSFGCCTRLLLARGLKLSGAFFISALLLTFPTVFWKTIQFTSMAVYIPCLLVALWAVLRRRWLAFFFAWGLACAARQSAVAWALLPLGVALSPLWRERRMPRPREVGMPLIVVLGGGLLVLGLRAGMNPTHAQRMVTEHTFERVSANGMLRTACVGLLVYGVTMGVGLLVEGLMSAGRGGVRLRSPLVRLLLLVAGSALAATDLRSLVQWEHLAMNGPTGSWYLKFLVMAGAAGWMLRGSVIRGEMAWGTVAALGLVSLRESVWDYYFIDLAALGFFGATLRMEPTPDGASIPMGMRRTGQAVLVAFAVIHALLVLDFKAWIDRATTLSLLSERALRAGRIQADELHYASFGFAAWHLYPYYIQHEGRTSAQIDGFNAYLRPEAMLVAQDFSPALHVLRRFRYRAPADMSTLVAEDHARLLWFFRGGYYLLRHKSAEESPAAVRLPADFSPEPFPLNEAEWRQLINGKLEPRATLRRAGAGYRATGLLRGASGR